LHRSSVIYFAQTFNSRQLLTFDVLSPFSFLLLNFNCNWRRKEASRTKAKEVNVYTIFKRFIELDTGEKLFGHGNFPFPASNSWYPQEPSGPHFPLSRPAVLSSCQCHKNPSPIPKTEWNFTNCLEIMKSFASNFFWGCDGTVLMFLHSCPLQCNPIKLHYYNAVNWSARKISKTLVRESRWCREKQEK